MSRYTVGEGLIMRYQCKTQFDEVLWPGDFASCPKCGSQDIVEVTRKLGVRKSG